ncbi:hypothetical protein HYN59_11495 [Flavobacterium album]|uniref:Uncharacterized protein n=1 Tax=Flavobacterium album TaxID=2175091 RepID=A0A2S1QZ86_9FLAO|nr:hypothetical protein [Flavobacterium album]AWH85692.1 hypothetical protein HYN59_11495 [Flavobacterium album]
MIHSDNKGYIPGENKEEQSSPAPQKNMGKGYEEKAATGRNHAENMDENERRNLNADQEKRSGNK